MGLTGLRFSIKAAMCKWWGPKLAVEWAHHNITVNAVAPGFTATEMNQAARDDERMREVILRPVPLRRFGEVDEVAQSVAYLSSDAARLMTGQTS